MSNPVRAQRLSRVGTGRRLPLALLAFVFSAATASGQSVNSHALRGMVQAEKDAGRLSGYHIAETFGAVGATTSRSATHGGRESEAQAARSWAEAFCASATRNFRWNRRWKLVVYTQDQPHPSHSCLIPTPVSDLRKPSEDRVTRDDDGGVLIAPVDEVD